MYMEDLDASGFNRNTVIRLSINRISLPFVFASFLSQVNGFLPIASKS